MNQLENCIFQFVLKNKQNIIKVFKVLYVIYIVWLIFGVVAVYSRNDSYNFYITNAVNLGKAALIFFCITISSGILRRFGVLKRISSALMLIRRYLGISTFLLAFGHYSLLRGVTLIAGQRPFTLPPVFEFFGMMALFTLSLLFFTSNDWSVKKLGKNWSKLHKLVYIIVWLIFSHVVLQKIDTFTYIIGIFAVLEVASLVLNHIKMKRKSAAMPVPPSV